jgi:hypothetical protein
MATGDKTLYASKWGTIKKLTESNYPKWKNDLTAILNAMDAFEIVTGEEEQPPAGNSVAARAAHANYRKRQANAVTAIRFSCSDAVAVFIEDLRSPAEMWKTLQDHLDSTASYMGRLNIVNKFHDARPVAGESMKAYIVRLQSYCTQIAASPEAITDQALRNHIFRTVPITFKHTISYLKRTPDVTIATISTALTEDEQDEAIESKVGDQNLDATSGTAAFAKGGKGGKGEKGGKGWKGGKGGKGDGKWKQQKTYRCTNCKMDNHTTETCRRHQNPQPIQSRKHARSSSIVCFHCLEAGHTIKDCNLRARAIEYKKNRESARALLVTGITDRSLVRIGSGTSPQDNPENLD